MCWNANNTKIEYIQSFNSINDFHGMWFVTDSKSYIKHVNSTNIHVNQGSFYGSGINIAIRSEDIPLQYFNFVSNEGKPSIIGFEQADSLKIDFYYANIINNEEEECLIYSKDCNKSTINIYSSNFIIKGNTIYNEYTTAGNNKFNFKNCSFNKQINQENIVFYEDCSFDEALN